MHGSYDCLVSLPRNVRAMMHASCDTRGPWLRAPPHAPGFLRVLVVSGTLFLCFTNLFRKPGIQKKRRKKGRKREERATRGGGSFCPKAWWTSAEAREDALSRVRTRENRARPFWGRLFLNWLKKSTGVQPQPTWEGIGATSSAVEMKVLDSNPGGRASRKVSRATYRSRGVLGPLLVHHPNFHGQP